MWPDRVSNPGPLTYESDALPIVLRGQAAFQNKPLLISGTNMKSTELLSQSMNQYDLKFICLFFNDFYDIVPNMASYLCPIDVTEITHCQDTKHNSF